jgi:hypothetical protein
VDYLPGLNLVDFRAGEKDLRAAYARILDIKGESLSVRLYLVDRCESGRVRSCAVFQCRSELVDARTPTCETWRYVDELQYKGVALDEFMFEMEGDEVEEVNSRALGMQLRKDVN